MPDEKLVYQDSNGIRRSIIFDRDDPDRFVQHTQVDVGQIIETNKALSEAHPARSTNKLVARAPLTVYEQSVRENWDEEQWKRWLNDPDNAAFRVWRGRV